MLSLLAVAAILASPSTTSDVPVEERQVLMELYRATGGQRWSHRDGWDSERPVCEWYGVLCDFDGGDAERPVVAGLQLESNGLAGAIPSSLATLEHLQSVSVWGNRLSGAFPEALLERWDRHDLEFDGSGNTFSNLLVRARIDYTSSGTLCSASEDVRYRIDVDEPNDRARFQSVRCRRPASRDTFCLVREGHAPSLSRLSRALKVLGFTEFEQKYDYPFSGVTHDVFVTTAATWGDGSETSVASYGRQGPIRVWTAQQLFLGLSADHQWERESRKPKCDFQQ